MKINKFYWHDGNIISTSFYINKKGKSNISITASFYKNEQTAKRHTYQIICKNVNDFQISLNTKELKNNISAGNINNGYLKKDTLWIYLMDGILKVTAKKFKINKI